MTADVYTGTRGDWLYRQHVKHVRKRIRQAYKAEGQELLKLPEPKQAQSFTNIIAPQLRKKRGTD